VDASQATSDLRKRFIGTAPELGTIT